MDGVSLNGENSVIRYILWRKFDEETDCGLADTGDGNAGGIG